MSAFGTKKKYGDLALQLTYPDVTAAFVATEPDPYGYTEDVMIGKARLYAGDDLQQRYHEEKKRHADRNAMNWVHNNARTRWLMNHNTFGFTQPYPHLSQRVYANPSYGNFSDIYAARNDVHIPSDSSALHGGVLRTAEGQKYGRNLLRARIQQLNTIDAGRPPVSNMPFAPAQYPAVPEIPREPETQLTSLKIDLRGKLEDILGVLTENASIDDLSISILANISRTISEAQKLLFRMAPDFTMSEFNNVLSYITQMKALVLSDDGARVSEGRMQVLEPIEDGIKVLDDYTRGMISVINFSRDEKIAKSKNLVESLGVALGTRRGEVTSPVQQPQSDIFIGPQSRAGRRRGGAPPPPPDIFLGPQFQNSRAGRRRRVRGGEDVVPLINPMAAPLPMEASPPLDAPPVAPKILPRGVVSSKKVNKPRTPRPVQKFAQRERGAKFDIDQRINFGDRQGAYLGEQIGDRVPVVPVPVPVEPNGKYVHPGSGYTRPTFPKFPVQKKPSNSLKPQRVAPMPELPPFQETAAGIFSAPRMQNAPVTSVPERPPFSYVGDLTRKTLPKTVEGFSQLAKELADKGHLIRFNPTSKLTSIRATFIRKLKL